MIYTRKIAWLIEFMLKELIILEQKLRKNYIKTSIT